MDTLTKSAKCFLVALTAAALALAVSLAFVIEGPANPDIARIAFIVGIATLAYRFPVSFGFKRRIYLDVVAISCAAMVLDPGVAALVIGTGAMAGQLLRARVWDEAIFNASQAMLQTMAGGLLLGALGWQLGSFLDSPPEGIGGICAFLFTIYAINTVMLAAIIGLQSGIGIHRVLAESGTSLLEFVSQATQVAGGVLTAVLITTSLWLGGLVLVPLGLLYLTLRHSVQQQKFAIIGMLDTLADLVDFRDPHTATHARRVAEIARSIALEMKLPKEQVDLIWMAARYHNLGSLTIAESAPETVGGLHSDAWNIMRQVPSMSAALLQQFPDTALAGNLIEHHLERYDGEGYPNGLAGDEIPLGSRVIAVADSIDAMMRHRPYRPALCQSEIRTELERFRGAQWDPRIIDVALDLIDRDVISIQLHPDIREEQEPSDGPAAIRTIDQQIQHQAFHDPLTDLPNRLLLMTRMSRSLTGDGPGFAVLFIDLDGFKQVNDLLGHRAGDRVLVEATGRMAGELRAGDLLARLGGDEFVALLWDVATPAAAHEIAGRIIESLAAPFSGGHRSVRLAASIGVAIAMPGVDTPEQLLHRADSAMYDAKHNGKGRSSTAPADLARQELTDLLTG